MYMRAHQGCEVGRRRTHFYWEMSTVSTIYIQNAPLDPHFITIVCVALDTGCSAQNENPEKEKIRQRGFDSFQDVCRWCLYVAAIGKIGIEWENFQRACLDFQ